MEKDHLNLLCSVNELSSILAGSSDISSFLDQIVETICTHIRTDVCSIYLYEEQTETLSLKATRGLNREAVGDVVLKLGEGLVGMALKKRRPICEERASENPNYKHFSDLDRPPHGNITPGADSRRTPNRDPVSRFLPLCDNRPMRTRKASAK